MSEFIEQFKSNIDADSARSDFPEITDSETPIWRGGPAASSMGRAGQFRPICGNLADRHNGSDGVCHMHANSYQDQSLCKFLHFWKVDNILASDLLHYPTNVETDGCSGVDRGFL